jgi:hypothetical protein
MWGRESIPLAKMETRVMSACVNGEMRTAVYVKKAKGWRLERADPDLEFLRYCGAKDAVLALTKRSIRWMWV